MKHFFFSILLSALCSMSMAQINLREGIVITLAGDTLHGDIDYRTDAINAEQCLFRKDGQNEFQTYKPGEIEGYRFMNNGRFYISKTVNTGAKGGVKTLFLEYLVKGQLNLYYRDTHYIGEYYLEDEFGNVARFEEIEKDAPKKQRQKVLSQAYNLLGRSAKAQQILWWEKLTRENVTKAVIAFNDDVCPDQRCEILEHRSKKLPKQDFVVHFLLKAGFAKINASYQHADENAELKGFSLSAGVLYDMKRLSPNLYAETILDYNHKIEFDDITLNEWILKMGIGYQWKKLPVHPRIHGGLALTTLFSKYFSDKDFCFGCPAGYFGAGILFPIGQRGGITLDVDYSVNRYKMGDLILDFIDIDWQFRRLSLSVGYQF